MCHRTNKEKPVLDLPESCRAAADRMEQALREEDAGSYGIADISNAANSVITEAEKQLSQNLDKDIVLIAYEAK